VFGCVFVCEFVHDFCVVVVCVVDLDERFLFIGECVFGEDCFDWIFWFVCVVIDVFFGVDD